MNTFSGLVHTARHTPEVRYALNHYFNVYSKINNWGGSLSIGHPFGATGSRITTNACHRLQREDGKYAIVAACADSGLAYGGLIERA